MDEQLKDVLIFSNMQFESPQLSKANADGFSLVYSKGKARLVDEILSIRPVGLVIDADYCQRRGMTCQFLLQKVQHSLGNTPAFLINGKELDYIKLMADNLLYAIIQGKPDLGKISSSLKKYLESNKRRSELTRVRNDVSVPCLLKKLGTSGLVQGKICDLSPKGMKIVLDRPCDEWAIGDEIRFSFTGATQKGGHLDGYGRLRWYEKNNVPPSGATARMGLEFSQLPQPTLYEFLDILNASRSGV